MAIVEAGIAAAQSPGAAKLFASAAVQLGKTLAGPARNAAIKTLASLSSYSSYIDETNDRVSTVKTFANPSLPVSLIDHFVTTNLTIGENRRPINQDKLIAKITKHARIVVSATAGYGKSMLMKYIALSLYENPRGKIPIFVELRHINRLTSPNLLAFMHSTYQKKSEIDIEAFRQGLQYGAFVLILDGFDEINHESRSNIEAQILELAKRYLLVSIVVSGRPDDKFLSWRVFEVYKICPMNQAQVIELVNKLEYDLGTKKRFIQKTKTGLYESHKSFMSTPLLAVLMLLTFEENANIPDKMHLFYSKAFETLFHKHDAMKEQYDRQRKSGLQIDDFERVFAIFCLATYVQEKIEFTNVELSKIIKSSIEYCGFELDVPNVLFDLEEAVCLLQKEGNSYFFVHRSFQEYFTAVFLATCPLETRDDFIDQVSVRYWDNVLPMLFDMASDQIEPTWVVEKSDSYLKKVTELGNDAFAALVVKWLGMGFVRRGDVQEVYNVITGDYSRFIAVMHRFYPTEMASDVHIKFEAAKKLLSLEPSEEKSKATNGDDYSISNVHFKREHIEILTESRMLAYSEAELDSIRKIRAGIDMQQAARGKFLDKLFSGRKS